LVSTIMLPAVALLCLAGLAGAQSAAVIAHSVSQVPLPETTNPIVVNPLSFVPVPSSSSSSIPTDPDVSVLPLSGVNLPLSLSWSSTMIPLPTSTGTKATSNKGKIAGGVVGGLAILVAALGACIFIRLRRRSTSHWRNRTKGQWQDQEAKSTAYPFGQGYGHDVKAPISSPTTAAPIFIREPRRSHRREESIEMQNNTMDANRFF